MRIIKRDLTAVVQHSLKVDRVTAIMGPRQAGKTTLVKHLLSAERPVRYFNLKDPDIRRALRTGSKQEFDYYRDHTLVLDEIQQVPDLMEIIQLQVDKYPNQKGQFLLLGSNHLLLNKQIKESLAGRVALFRLLPLSFSELAEDDSKSLFGRLYELGCPEEVPRLLKEFYVPIEISGHRNSLLSELNIFGGYPEFLTRKDPDDRKSWLSSYNQTYLETDLRELVDIRNRESFERFEKLFSARVGNLMNLSEIARDCGVSADTIKRFIGYYRQLFISWQAQPYHSNLSKRVVKMPKWYFYDTGLLRSIMGDFTSSWGTFFENTILSELQKALYMEDPHTRLYFSRTATGVEADAVFSSRERKLRYFIEVKQSTKSHKTDIRHLKKYISIDDHHIGLLLNNSTSIEELHERIWSIPVSWYF